MFNNKILYYLFILSIGVLFKLIDDIIDMPQIFSKNIINNVYLLKIIFIISTSYLIYYEKHIIPALFLTVIGGLYVDNTYDLNNIDNIYWYICSLIIIIYFIIYLIYNINDFYNYYSNIRVIFLIALFYFLSLLEMLIFKEESSIQKIIFRLIVIIVFSIILIYTYISRNFIVPKVFYKVFIVLIGYAFMSVINMIYLFLLD